MSLEPFRVKLIEVVAAEFLIHATFALKVIADDQQAMSYSDEGSFATSSCGQSFELSGGNSSSSSPLPTRTDRPYGVTMDCPCGSCR